MDYNTWLENTPINFKKKFIETFVLNTVSYAKSHITARKKEILSVSDDDLEFRLARLQKWLAYIEFQEHTLAEIKGKKLDHLIP